MKSLMQYSAIALVAVGAATAAAQDPYVKIREPVEWRDGKSFVVAAGRAVKISGVAWHPSGIRQVLVNGTAASLDPDPPLTNFEHVITADSIPRTISVTIVPENSVRFETQFAMAPPEVRRVGDSTPPAIPTTQLAAATQSGTTISPMPAIDSAPRPRVVSSGGFRKRGIFYVGAAVAGGVLGSMTSKTTSEVCSAGDCVDRTEAKASYRPIGLGLIAAAVVAGVVDFMKTSGGAKMSSATSDRSDARSAKLFDGPSYVSRGSVGVSLVQLKF